MSAPLAINAVVLSSLRYGETSKILRLATREMGVQSAIAKGASRPRSRFGAALQPLSYGQGLLIPSRRSDLHTLTAFEVIHVPTGLGLALERWVPGLVLAELMLRFASDSPHEEAFDLLLDALRDLEQLDPGRAGAHGLAWLWRLVSLLGWAPALDACVIDAVQVPHEGPLPFSALHGGVLCAVCARTHAVSMLSSADRLDLVALLDPASAPPNLDAPHEAAHRRLVARFIKAHLGEDSALHALEFWQRLGAGAPA